MKVLDSYILNFLYFISFGPNVSLVFLTVDAFSWTSIEFLCNFLTKVVFNGVTDVLFFFSTVPARLLFICLIGDIICQLFLFFYYMPPNVKRRLVLMITKLLKIFTYFWFNPIFKQNLFQKYSIFANFVNIRVKTFVIWKQVLCYFLYFLC